MKHTYQDRRFVVSDGPPSGSAEEHGLTIEELKEPSQALDALPHVDPPYVVRCIHDSQGRVVAMGVVSLALGLALGMVEEVEGE